MKSTCGKKIRIAAGLLVGCCLLQAGNCTTQKVKTQFANGLSTALNGVFNIGTTNLANEIFDVDD